MCDLCIWTHSQVRKVDCQLENGSIMLAVNWQHLRVSPHFLPSVSWEWLRSPVWLKWKGNSFSACFYFLDFTYEFIQRGGLRDPIIFEKPDGLGIKYLFLFNTSALILNLFIMALKGSFSLCLEEQNITTKMRLMCLVFFCRMPDPDFSVNDVKMFVGKSSVFLSHSTLVRIFKSVIFKSTWIST